MNWERCRGTRGCKWCNKKIEFGEMFMENVHGYYQGYSNYCADCIIKEGKKAEKFKKENIQIKKIPLKERKIKLKMLESLNDKKEDE